MHTVHELSRTEARRIAVRAKLLTKERPSGLLELRATLRPAEDIPLYRAQMAEWPGTGELLSLIHI